MATGEFNFSIQEDSTPLKTSNMNSQKSLNILVHNTTSQNPVLRSETREKPSIKYNSHKVPTPLEDHGLKIRTNLALKMLKFQT